MAANARAQCDTERRYILGLQVNAINIYYIILYSLCASIIHHFKIYFCMRRHRHFSSAAVNEFWMGAFASWF